jgi:hypothetical protein
VKRPTLRFDWWSVVVNNRFGTKPSASDGDETLTRQAFEAEEGEAATGIYGGGLSSADTYLIST